MTNSKIKAWKIRPHDRIIIDVVELYNKNWEALPEHKGY